MKYYLLFFLLLTLALIPKCVNAQILFAEDCFVGGVTVAGINQDGGASFGNSCNIKWESTFTLKKAYAITYRYGRPLPHNIFMNGYPINWNFSNQVGPELLESNTESDFYATHALEISDMISISSDEIIIDFPIQSQLGFGANWNWCGVYLVILYESPEIITSVCNRIYTANQRQDFPQIYTFDKPAFPSSSDLLFSIFSARITEYYSDRSIVRLNQSILGEILGPDSVTPLTLGAQGSYYYENGTSIGLNGDIANNIVEQGDGIAIINEYLASPIEQSLQFQRAELGGGNLHPAFCLTYTPTCTVSNQEMQRAYSFCKSQSTPLGVPDITDTIQLNAIPGYDHYEWTPSSGVSNADIANPLCYADSSGWYRVRMWNDDEEGVCAQTIPVFITVGKVPRPDNLQIRASFCPQNTGRIVFGEMAGKAPFQYTVNGTTKTNATFENLAPGVYDVSVTDALGCRWDSTAVVDLDPIQTAAFTANPDSGYSPLQVVLTNQSTQATDYTWLVNGVPFSNSTNTSYTFADTGTYIIALIAIRNEESCADTAYATIHVDQGLKLIVPNIITPNGDGRNDALVAQTAGVAYMRWEILNRWGNLLHSDEATSPPEALTLWSPSSGEVVDGVYTITVTVKGESGELREFVSQVTVISN